MDRQSESLTAVMRCEITAVNQQFTHVLALREWGESEIAERIMQVDYIDFPNAMRIIDYLVETGVPVVLAPDRFTPGTDIRSILVAERAMEQRISAALETAVCSGGRAKALISTAKTPRKAYAAWLADRLGGSNQPAVSVSFPATEASSVFALLIAMIEQAMVHAFVHWHRGAPGNADAAWATSGAAMMYMTEFVHLFAARNAVPIPGEAAPLYITDSPAEALECDRRLARRCADEATAVAVGCEDPSIGDLCRKVADCCLELSRWSPEQAHPAASRNPPAFSSFEATLKRYVWAE